MQHRLGRVFRSTLVAAGLCAIAAHASSPVAGQVQPAQQSEARLQGVVVDQATYQPLDSATVSLAGMDGVATTGRWGGFSFPDAPIGTVSIRVSAPGHVSVVQSVEVSGDRILFVRVVLPSVAATLAELLVQSTPRYSAVEAAQTAADLLAIEVPRARVKTSAVGRNDYRIVLRPGNTALGTVEPLILIDGVVMANGGAAYEALLNIPASDVEDIQVLKGAAAFLYPLAANGVILVRTIRGRRR